MRNITLANRGMSNLVSALAIMVVSMILAISLGAAITSLSRLSLSPALSCTQLQINSPIALSSVCYDSSSAELRATISRNLGADVSQFELSLIDGAQNKKFSCTESCGTCTILGEGSTRQYIMSVPELNLENRPTASISSKGCALGTKTIKPC